MNDVTGQLEESRRREDFSSRVAALLTAYRAEMAVPTTDIQDCSGIVESQRQSPAQLRTGSVSSEPVCDGEQSEMHKDQEVGQEPDR